MTADSLLFLLTGCLCGLLCVFTGAWLYHRASSGKSPLPDLPRCPAKAEKPPKKHNADGMV